MENQPGSIIQALQSVCERTPERICIRFEGRRYTYAEVWQAAQDWATFLHESFSLQKGDRIALFLDNSAGFVIAYLGTHMAGGSVVLINTQYRQTELRHILRDAGVRVCVTGGEYLVELERVASDTSELQTVIVLDGLHTAPSSTQYHSFDVCYYDMTQSRVPLQLDILMPQSDDIALIAYTSGTTGRSKGAMLTHGNLAANSYAVTRAWKWTEHDQLLLTLPLFHIHGLGVGINGTLVAGSTVDLRRRFDASEVYDTVQSGETTLYFGVPTMYTRLIAEAKSRRIYHPEMAHNAIASQIRLFVSGSAPLAPQTFEEFETLFGQRILERYGMTETVMNLTNPHNGERRPGTVGQPFPGQEARIVDVRTRQPIANENQGEIQVRGPHVFAGYWQQPEATAEAFDADGWFNTGDLGWRSADGYYTISGRARELIITGGYNVYPREVEEVLLQHPAVAEAAVLGLPHADFGEQVVAVVVKQSAVGSQQSAETRDTRHETRNDEPKLIEELVDLCREQLASYKKPRQVFFVDALPRNALGKVQKHVLREQIHATIQDIQARSN